MDPIRINDILFYVDSLPEGGYVLRASTCTEAKQRLARRFAEYANIRILDDGTDDPHVFRAHLSNDMSRRIHGCVACFKKIYS